MLNLRFFLYVMHLCCRVMSIKRLSSSVSNRWCLFFMCLAVIVYIVNYWRKQSENMLFTGGNCTYGQSLLQDNVTLNDVGLMTGVEYRQVTQRLIGGEVGGSVSVSVYLFPFQSYECNSLCLCYRTSHILWTGKC